MLAGICESGEALNDDGALRALPSIQRAAGPDGGGLPPVLVPMPDEVPHRWLRPPTGWRLVGRTSPGFPAILGDCLARWPGPRSSTTMRSASRMVDSRWAMTRVVRPCIRCSRACRNWLSLTASRWDVASSSTNTGAFFSRARAMAIRCRCPPDSCIPRSPTMVSYPSGKAVMKSWQFACLAASSSSASEASGRPSIMFSPNAGVEQVGVLRHQSHPATQIVQLEVTYVVSV